MARTCGTTWPTACSTMANSTPRRPSTCGGCACGSACGCSPVKTGWTINRFREVAAQDRDGERQRRRGRSYSDRAGSAGFEMCNQVFVALRRDDVGDGFCNALSDRENLALSGEVHRQGFLAVAQPVVLEDAEAP